MIKQYINGMELIQNILQNFFPGRKVKLRRTRRFGEAIHRFSQIIRRGISDSEEKEYLPGDTKGLVKAIYRLKKFLLKSLMRIGTY